ncbi:snare-dependent exocytosis protein [Grosmannia clavigera kw1407]|uniref:Snare-dependent exocytosis protein n=1 Tax=Grosmannia clavigera (strain kw1407 / UAMH 11150) TaxID=655863 RepID=F0XNC9_GROCL|nr:snare-dependent exocytosis protein [Grosmannia clavigera kw1407]EFX00770.1 snare-dependent exocytosis protein [Grosmannia clavigera kw1407]
MASFIRGKQAGMQNDLSAGILPGVFTPEEQVRYGVASQISCLAYDPVQSLLAVGTTQSRFGRGTIYVYGQGRVHRVIQPKGGASLRQLQFSANRLVSLDAKSELALWNLDTGERVAGTVSAGPAAAMATDPMLDWAFLGLSNGEVVAYDLDRERLSPLRVPNLWRTRPDATDVGRVRARPATSSTMVTASMGLVSLQLHPRDAGKLLVGYSKGAVIYSFKHEQATRYFEYVVPAGAPGGNGETPDVERRPRLIQALWHPTGTFVLTAHDDGSLVFWDPKDGRVVLARSLYASGVDQASAGGPTKPRLLDPFVKIAWCCKKNPDDTALLVAGGLAFDAPEKGLTFLDLGPTPVYATSSWQMLSDHFRGKRQQLLPIPPGTEISGFCLAPRLTPHFDGASDPIAVFTLLSSGEMLTLSFPSGFPISPTNQLHPSISFVAPFVSQYAVATMARDRWLGLTETRNTGEPLLRGGAPAPRPRRRYERRNILQTAHADGTVRIWDAGHGDEIENPAVLQVDVARAVARDRDVEITALSLAAVTGELAIGTRVGEVVLFRWGTNRTFGSNSGDSNKTNAGPSNPGGFTDISKRTEDSLQDGLQPWVLYEMLQGPVSMVAGSDVGFVAAGSENGFLSIIDLRGPSLIFHGALADFAKSEKRSSFLGGRHGSGSSSSGQKKDYPVVAEFAVLSLEGKSYSSLVCLVGTQQGKLLTFELLPSADGYTAKLAGMTDLKDKIVAICPIVADTGVSAVATGAAVAGLRSGQHVNGTLVVATQSEARIFRPVAAKGASKSFDDVFCYAAEVVHNELHGHALVGMFGDGTTRAFTLPGLKEISRAPLAQLDAARLGDAVVSPSGDIFGWTGPSELVIVSSWGAVRGPDGPGDTLVNPDLAVPPRPTISNLQWISGTQYVSPLDLDLLIGGPDRPPSNRMMAAAAEEARIARHQGATGAGAPPGQAGLQRAGTGQEGWGQYLSRQFNERTEKLTFVSDGMDNLQEQSQGWADDVSKYVSNQKRSLVMGAVKSKFL